MVLDQHDRVISSLVLVNTPTCVNERITDMMSAGPFVAGLKCSGNVFGDSVHLHGKCMFIVYSMCNSVLLSVHTAMLYLGQVAVVNENLFSTSLPG